MKDLISKIKENTKINDLENIEKAKSLENLKPSTKSEILYFLEAELTHIKNGFSNISIEDIDAKPLFGRRSLLEYLPMQRHPIPYCVISYKDKYFLALRENGSGEMRLIGKKGLLGGHIDKEDEYIINGKFSLKNTIENAMLRELNEEAKITKENIADIEFIGVIKIEELGSVENDHLGLIYQIELKYDDIALFEEGILSGAWFTKDEILNNFESLENWSKIVFNQLFK